MATTAPGVPPRNVFRDYGRTESTLRLVPLRLLGLVVLYVRGVSSFCDDASIRVMITVSDSPPTTRMNLKVQGVSARLHQ
jgi:hypothetical protein